MAAASLREVFARDGVVMVSGAVSAAWIGRLRAAADRLAPPDGSPRFRSLANSHRSDPVWHDFATDSGIAALAGNVLGAVRIARYADVLLVKDAHSPEPTAWHQDLPFWPFRADLLATVWVALDPVDATNGRVRFVAGSHRWNRWFAPAGIDPQSITDGPVESAPDTHADADLRAWDMAPGDVTIHHPLVLHGADGNATAAPRRAYALRCAGEGTRYTGETIVGPQAMAVGVGAPIDDDPAHPVLWRRT